MNWIPFFRHSSKRRGNPPSPLSSTQSNKLTSLFTRRRGKSTKTKMLSCESVEAAEGSRGACSTSQESDWFLVNPDESSTWTDFDCFPSRRTHCAPTDCGRVSRSAPCSPRPNRKSRPLSSLTSTGSSCDTITRTWSLSETDRMEGFAIRQPRSPLLSRSSASTLGRPSPTRDDRIAAFPDRPSRSSRSCSAPRLQNRKMRNSLGSSDLTRARVSFRDAIDADDRDKKEHFTVHTIMVNHRETDDMQQQLNQYIVGDVIGRGSFGVVRKCTNVFDKKDYALKVIPKGRLRKESTSRKLGAAGRDSLQAVKHEIAILKKVNHRNIVKLMEVIDGEKEDEMYLVFELVEQGHLFEVNVNQTIPEERAWDYFIDILLGVEYLHYLNIVHRDIKPSNLLLDSEDRVKIADFGVSKMFADSRPALLSRSAGSPAFMAPETLKDESSETLEYGAKPADVWSMGVTLYCMVFGICPFWPRHRGDILDLHDKILHEELQFPDMLEISLELRNLLICLLEKDPAKRITIPEIRNHMWVIGRIGQHCQRLDENNVADTTVTDEEVTAAYGQGHRTRITVSESYHLLHNNVTNLITEDSGLGSSREVSPSHIEPSLVKNES
ncbi:calcium/calmodulin-dependent protein kinase kinase 1-like [Corticium candelabrum]|uniref:calcium/calmodulin-dependent protein kinase kinase 1-like n=1 Tax=Corticium candelabrum TaxID=121492 RepID=UPI002E25A9CB|nr:calcium/calmodulin-dependent protein kinase kinase 1-like [Corticium candelabrum]